MTNLRFGFRILACAIAPLLTGVPALANPTLESYGALPTVQMMSVSPDGTMVAFRRRSGEGDIVVVYSLREGKVITGLDVAEIRPTELYFLDHSRIVLVASDEKRLFGYRGKRRISTAFSLDITTNELSQLLTPGDNIIVGQLGLGEIVGISPDGKRVYMPAYVEHRNRGRSDYALMEVDLESVRRPDIVTRGTPSTVDYFVDANGEVLAEEIFNNHTDERDHSLTADGAAGARR